MKTQSATVRDEELFSYSSRRGTIMQHDLYQVQLALISAGLEAQVVARKELEGVDTVTIGGVEGYEAPQTFLIECKTANSHGWTVDRPFHAFSSLKRKLLTDMESLSKVNTARRDSTTGERMQQAKDILAAALQCRAENGSVRVEVLAFLDVGRQQLRDLHEAERHCSALSTPTPTAL